MTAVPIVALDVQTMAAALALVDVLGDRCAFYKVGSELFTATGPSVVRALCERGKKVFLDLKLHDIPNTVRGAAQSAATLGASLLTVHAVGGESMIRAAVDGAGSGCQILAVTILTSLDSDAVSAVWGRSTPIVVEDEVLRLAAVAQAGGAHGVVCSGREVASIHRRFGGEVASLVPGLRFADGDVHDQARVVTPGAAVSAGARYLVLGRAVSGAADPGAAMARVWSEIETASR